MAELKNPKVVHPDFTSNGSGGNGNMDDKYVSRREFESTVKNLDRRFDETNSRIDRLTTALYWLTGIVFTGIIIPLLMLMVKALFLSK